MAIFRGEIYFVCLGPTVGREINTKRRPVAVLSINDLNSKPLVVTVVPGSTWSGKRIFPTEAKIEPTETNGLSNPTLFLCTNSRRSTTAGSIEIPWVSSPRRISKRSKRPSSCALDWCPDLQLSEHP